MMEGMEQKEMNVAELMQGMQMAGATLVDGETVHVVIGSPPKEPVHVSGTVTLSGKPVEGGILSFFGEGRAVMENLAFASVDADGNYDLILEGGGPYLISVQRMGASALEQITIELTRTIPNEEEVRLDIALPEARISGKIQSPDGSPAAETRVSIYTEGATSTGTMLGGSYVEAVSDVDGVYDIRGLQAGSYFVCAGGPSMMGLQSDSEEQASGRVFSDTFTLKENQWVQNVNLKLKSPGTLRARMLDEEGKPVGGAALFMRDHRGRPLESFSFDDFGQQRIRRVHGLGTGFIHGHGPAQSLGQQAKRCVHDQVRRDHQHYVGTRTGNPASGGIEGQGQPALQSQTPGPGSGWDQRGAAL